MGDYIDKSHNPEKRTPEQAISLKDLCEILEANIPQEKKKKGRKTVGDIQRAFVQEMSAVADFIGPKGITERKKKVDKLVSAIKKDLKDRFGNDYSSKKEHFEHDWHPFLDEIVKGLFALTTSAEKKWRTTGDARDYNKYESLRREFIDPEKGIFAKVETFLLYEDLDKAAVEAKLEQTRKESLFRKILLQQRYNFNDLSDKRHSEEFRGALFKYQESVRTFAEKMRAIERTAQDRKDYAAQSTALDNERKNFHDVCERFLMGYTMHGKDKKDNPISIAIDNPLFARRLAAYYLKLWYDPILKQEEAERMARERLQRQKYDTHYQGLNEMERRDELEGQMRERSRRKKSADHV